ncbi:hypothetical protein GGR52DRAFT_504018 [Hypoxylon sp. FL1284]|nr:hypothetical protein GGR52DRAFT_504018 [Hypoxylon sp. FL1284]
MDKITSDMTMAWFAHPLQAQLMPAEIWTVITWIAFFFKLASLAFAAPILSLIVFDFCLWIWRLNRPQSQDAAQPKHISRKATGQGDKLTMPSSGTSSTIARSTNIAATQRRPVYSGQMGD